MLQAVFNDVKGDECVFLWRSIGAALVSLVSVTSYSLRVGFYMVLTMTCYAHHSRRSGRQLCWVHVIAETAQALLFKQDQLRTH